MDISRFLVKEIDMDHLRNSVSMEELTQELQDLYSGKNTILMVLVHKPMCPYCQEYYPEFNRICDELPGLCKGKGKGVAIEYDDLDEDSELYESTDRVPRVLYYMANGDDTVTTKDFDESTRRAGSVIPLVESIMSSNMDYTEEDEPILTITPKEESVSVKKSKSKKETPKKTTAKKKKKMDQKGRGFVESAIAAAVLSTGANTVNNSPTIQKYIKQVESGLIGLSKASADLTKGATKVLSEQDFMKKLSNATRLLGNKKSRKRTSNKTRKSARKNKRKQTRKR